MLDRLDDKIHFAILNGDFIYERGRDYTVPQWADETGLNSSQIPNVVQIAPAIVGIWENYKLYLEDGSSLAAWHREVPSFFLYDDHEIINDIAGTGTRGHRDPITVLRDPGVQAWYDYVGWSNPMEFSQEIRFGRAELTEDSDVLVDLDADFSRFDLNEAGNLHVHWGGPPPGAGLALDPIGDPNAGVYDIVEIVDSNRLRISPSARDTGTSSYSIGRLTYWNKQVGNAEFFVVDTRGYRDVIDVNRPFDPNTSILGARQKEWLKQEMSASDADFLFVVSTVNLSIQHVLPQGGNKDEAWTGYAVEREEMLEFWDALGKPVMVLTGDLHNSFAIKLTDRVWEFASGPHSSQNHTLGAERNRPPNGPYQSQGREVDIRWSTFFIDDAPGMGTSRSYGQPVYTVVKVNNVFLNSDADGDRWLAYTRPQVVFQFYDARTGDLLYAEAIPASR
jgi:alkaline phosphatase D